MDWIYSLFINFCLLIDKMIYSINNLLFELFMEVAQARFESDVFEKLINNLYVIVGIFVMFKVAFSLIQMLANPDVMTDKEKGAGKLATRIVISFALIIMVPTIFDYAYSLQSAILEDNILGRLILGDSGQPENSSVNNVGIVSQGQRISATVFKRMITISDNVDVDADPGKKCKAALDDESKVNIDDLRNVDGTDCFTDKSGNEYIYNYKFLVSSLVLGMVAWLLVGFCIDIGVRLIKLTFLQLIAPICIVTYIGGSRDNAFNKWTKMTISSYISMFVKLVIIYFIVFLAGNLNISGLNLNGLGYVVVILGLLVFAKNATKLIGDLFGIKMDEESGFKGIAKTALLGGAAMAASGGLAGISNIARGIGNTRSAIQDARKNGTTGWGAGLAGAGKTLASGIAGMGAGAFLGAKNGFGKNATLGGSINKALMTSNANREQRADRSSIGYGIGSRIGDFAKGAAGIDTKAKAGAIAAKNRLAGLQNSRNVLAQRQYENSKNMDPNVLSQLSRYTYDAKEGLWKGTDGNTIDITKMYTEITGNDFNRDYYVMPDGTFDEASYNRNVELEMKSRYSDEFNYIQQTKQISEMDGQIIKAEKEVGKWQKEQDAVERKTSSGNK